MVCANDECQTSNLETLHVILVTKSTLFQFIMVQLLTVCFFRNCFYYLYIIAHVNSRPLVKRSPQMSISFECFQKKLLIWLYLCKSINVN